jgi:hypothetical protein
MAWPAAGRLLDATCAATNRHNDLVYRRFAREERDRVAQSPRRDGLSPGIASLELATDRFHPFTEAEMRGVLCNAFDGIEALTIGEAEEPRPGGGKS